MIHETIFLKNVNEKILSDASIVSYCPDNFLEYSIGRIRKCILVIPGGGYEFVSEREADNRPNCREVQCEPIDNQAQVAKRRERMAPTRHFRKRIRTHGRDLLGT